MTETKKLIPKRRFKEFQNAEAWEQRKLGEICNSYSGGTPSAGNHLYYGGHIPFIRSGEINAFETNLFLSDKGLKSSSAKLVRKGDILYALYGATSGEVGVSQIEGAINQAILAIQPHAKYGTYFISQWLKKEKNNIINRCLQGGQGNLSGNIVKELSLDLPTDFNEQQQVGNFFRKLDNLITLHQRKLDKIKSTKKAYLYEMFPAEGESKPKRRFKGFTDDWELCKVQNFVDDGILAAPMDGNHGEKHPTTRDYVASGIPFIMARDLDGGQVDLKHCSFISAERAERLDKGFAQNNDVLLTHKATIGETAIIKELKEKYAVLTPQVTYYRILNFKKLSTDYLYAYFNTERFQNELKTAAIQSTRAYIGITDQRKLSVTFPVNIEEQDMIGNLFTNLDNLITLHQHKLDKLKNLKKSYLNEMFI